MAVERDFVGHALYILTAFLIGIFGAAFVYTNLTGSHIKSLRRTLTSKGSSMFVTSIYGGAAFGGFVMGELVDHWGWQFAGQMHSVVVLYAVH